MIRRLIAAGVYLLGLLVLAWVFFFVPLGERTLYEHTVRIAATDEAQELGDDVEVAGDRIGEAVQEKLRESQLAGDAGPVEGAPQP